MPTTEQRRRAGLAEALRDPESFATTLAAIFLDEYGTTGLSWAPETIAMELRDDFGVEPPPANFGRLMAGITLLTTDRFYKELPTFVTLCNVLSGDSVNPGMWDPADALECAWGITEALLLGPPEDGDDEPFCDDIRYYVGHVLHDEGILDPPDVLQIALREPPHRRALEQAARHAAADPRIGDAIKRLEVHKTQEITDNVRDSLDRLITQVQGLSLSNGDTAGLIERLTRKGK
jgi:hypothetical protein